MTGALVVALISLRKVAGVMFSAGAAAKERGERHESARSRGPPLVIELRIEESREKTPVRLVDSHCHLDSPKKWL